MKLVCIGEGDTEFEAVPRLAANLGYTNIRSFNLGGLPAEADWDVVCREAILPLVRVGALREPDKILVVVDREKRAECCPSLATEALRILRLGLQAENLQADVAIVVCDRTFESIVMADFELVDSLPILARPISQDFGATLDGKAPLSILKAALRPGAKYDKVSHGAALASRLRMDDAVIPGRSRSLRKLIKELPTPIYF